MGNVTFRKTFVVRLVDVFNLPSIVRLVKHFFEKFFYRRERCLKSVAEGITFAVAFSFASLSVI